MFVLGKRGGKGEDVSKVIQVVQHLSQVGLAFSLMVEVTASVHLG